MKILAVMSTFPRTEESNDPPFNYYLYKSMLKKTDNIRVLCPHDPGIPQYEIVDGIEVYRFKYFFEKFQALAYGILPNIQNNWWLIYQIPFLFIFELIATIKHIREFEPDVIHTSWIIPQGFILAIVSYFADIPIILTAQGGDMMFLKNSNPLKRFFAKWVFSRMDKITAVNKQFVNEINEVDSKNAVFIPNGADEKVFDINRVYNSKTVEKLYHRYCIDADAKTLFFVGRLAEKKGLKFLLRSFSEVQQSINDNLQLLIVGEGPMKDELQKLSEKLKIADKVQFTGWVNHVELPVLMKASDIGVYPSFTTNLGDREGLPNVYVESIAMKLPVITTYIDGIDSIFCDGENAMLVSQKSVKELTEAIKKLLKDEVLRERLANKAYEDFLSSYRWDVIADTYFAEYKNIL